MAKKTKGGREKVRLVGKDSKKSGNFYVSTTSKKNNQLKDGNPIKNNKLVLKKYNPATRRHEEMKETKVD